MDKEKRSKRRRIKELKSQRKPMPQPSVRHNSTKDYNRQAEKRKLQDMLDNEAE